MNACHRFTASSPETPPKGSLFGITEQGGLAGEAVCLIGLQVSAAGFLIVHVYF